MNVYIKYMSRQFLDNVGVVFASTISGLLIGNGTVLINKSIRRHFNEKMLIKWHDNEFIGSVIISDYDNTMKRVYISPDGNTKIHLDGSITIIDQTSTKKLYPNGTTMYYHRILENGEVFEERLNENDAI